MKKIVFVVLAAILFYTRFVNLGWGLPYPLHPDERNMAIAVEQLSCPPLTSLVTHHQSLTKSLATCLNPHFFAYGQLPLYLARGGIELYHFASGQNTPPTSVEATLALRTISAFASIVLVFVLFKIIELIYPKKKKLSFSFKLLAFSFFIFQPYAIQFAHFGTTESLLMLFYTLIIYFSIKLLTTNHLGQSPIALRANSRATILYLSFFSGLALGTKTSSLLFLGIPILIIFLRSFPRIFATGGTIEGSPKSTHKVRPAGIAALEYFLGSVNRDGICRIIIFLFFYLFISLFFFILSSPQSFLNWNDFISAMNYESAVGLGTYIPFYTRQFVGTMPILFQFEKILPYVLGLPILIGALLGFFLLPSKFAYYVRKVAGAGGLPTRADSRHMAREHWRDGEQLTESSALLIDILRFALLFSFIPPSFFFAKWTRFISPSFPLFTLFALLFFLHIFSKISSIKLHTIKYGIFFISIIPGIAFLSVYQSPDIRFTASEWIYKNIPENSRILSETANVVDIPILPPDSIQQPKRYSLNSFNFYDLDSEDQLQLGLSEALKIADYIIIPSRRIFKNHPSASYPLLANYYENLFSGSLGFEKVAEFSSYPHISILGNTLFTIPDEEAEETWTVFDHPVIRIYKKKLNIKNQISNKSQVNSNQVDFSKYSTTNYQLLTTNYKLLVADTPERWEKGLMYVKNKADIGGRDGMIFTFPDSKLRTFWNKNTLSHLTLYWIQNKTVIGVSDLPSITQTGSITTVSSPSAADTVIEIIK